MADIVGELVDDRRPGRQVGREIPAGERIDCAHGHRPLLGQPLHEVVEQRPQRRGCRWRRPTPSRRRRRDVCSEAGVPEGRVMRMPCCLPLMRSARGRTCRAAVRRPGRAGRGSDRCSRWPCTRRPWRRPRRARPRRCSAARPRRARVGWRRRPRSWVAGHVITLAMSSSSSCGTPDAFMRCGCWPRYWVTINRAASRACLRSRSMLQITSCGRSRSSTERPARCAPRSQGIERR